MSDGDAWDAAALGDVPLFAGLDEGELDDLRWATQPFGAPAGQTLVSQGDRAEAMFVLLSGSVALTRRLAGERELDLGQVHAPAVLGEMALVDGGRRSATATVLQDVHGRVLGARAFEILMGALRPGAHRVARRLARTACERLRELDRLRCGADQSPQAEPDVVARLEAKLKAARSDRGHGLRLQAELLPALRELDGRELDTLFEHSTVLRLDKWQPLFVEGQLAASCFFVMRGAIQAERRRGERRTRLNLTGPGGVIGHLALLNGQTRSADCYARERSILLEFERERFDALFAAGDSAGLKLFSAVHRLLVDDLRRAHQRRAWQQLVGATHSQVSEYVGAGRAP